MKIYFFLLFLFAVSSNSFSFELQLDKKIGNKQNITSYIKDTLKLLPKSVKDYGRFKVKLQFSKLGSGKDITKTCDNNNGLIYGKYRKTFRKIKGIKKVQRTIILNELFLPYISNKEKGLTAKVTCKHNNLYKLAQATLLHEIAHVYDSHILFSRKYSSNNELKALGFWNMDSWFNKNHNTYHHRSVDTYEYSKKSEYFAVNFEYFLLDENYKCRRPSLSKYLEKTLKHTPFQNKVCNSYRTIEYPTKSGLEQIDLTTQNVVAIDFLYASKGTALMSRFGHSMFRLITCPKGESDVSLCRQKGNNHLIVGFLAHLDDFKINNIKGVMGDYPSELTIRSLLETRMSYNQAELRDLVSVPLKLNKEGRQRFLDHLLRIYWEYKGQYFFFSNNCASEAWKLLQVAFNQDKLYKKDFLTPVGLYKYLLKSDLVEKNTTLSKDELLRQGYLYEGFHTKLVQTFNVLKELESFKSVSSYESYIALGHKDRRVLIKEVLKSSSKRRPLYALYALENRASFEYGESLMAKISKYTDNIGPNTELNDLLKKLKVLKDEQNYGARMKEEGYGIPLQSDFKAYQQDMGPIETDDEKTILAEIQKIISNAFENDISESSEIKINKDLILDALDAL